MTRLRLVKDLALWRLGPQLLSVLEKLAIQNLADNPTLKHLLDLLQFPGWGRLERRLRQLAPEAVVNHLFNELRDLF